MQVDPNKLVLQPSTESVITVNVSVSLDFLVEGQVTWLVTVHPLLTLNFFCTWFLPLEKRKMLCSVMVGLLKNRQDDVRVDANCCFINCIAIFFIIIVLQFNTVTIFLLAFCTC